MDENFVGIKELYDVNLRTLKPLEIGGIKYDMNESILSFKRAEIAQVQQSIRSVSAKGGYHNPALINWDIDREVSFGITHGVLSPKSWSLLSNSKLKETKEKSVSFNEVVRTYENEDYCYVDLKYCPNACDKMGAQPNPYNEPMPMGRRPELLLKPLPPSKKKWIFVYDEDTGKRVRNFQIYQNRLYLQDIVKKVFVDYTFNYWEQARVIEVGNRLLNGFLKLDGKMSVKDDKTGEVSTGILELPKIKLSSSLSVKLGSNYDNSIVSDFYFTGYFDESERRENQVIAEVSFLEGELTGEYN